MSNYKDPAWRLENLYYVYDKKGRKTKFRPNTVQREINSVKSKRKIILKARQMGVSTNELIKQLDYVVWNKNVTACILAHEHDAIEKLFRIPRRAYEAMPEGLGVTPLDKGGGSKYEMYFPRINSRIFCDLESRSNTIHWLHVSERAFIEDRNRVMATIESVPLDGIITFESTPNGLNDFYDMWLDKESNYEKLFYPWYFHEEYFISDHELTKAKLTADELIFIEKAKTKYKINITLDQIAFRRFKQSELKGLFKQEYPEDDITCFLTSGANPFTLEIIKPMFDNAPTPVREVNGIKIYKERRNNTVYVIGADTAEGYGGDNCAAHVFDARTREQVASFKGNLKPSEFADKLVEMAKLFHVKHEKQPQQMPMIGVERNNHGHAVLLKLDEILNYPNLYQHEDERLGWKTDGVTRPIMTNVFIESVENGTTKLNDRETLGECLTLVNNNGKIEATEGKQDDLFIAACISVQLCIEEGSVSIYSNISNLIKF